MKFIFSFLSGLFLVTTSLGQSMPIQQIKVGLLTGLNVSKFNRDVEGFGSAIPKNGLGYDNYFRISGSIGVTFSYRLKRYFEPSVELLYTGRGMAYRRENSSVILIGEKGAEKAYNYYKYNINFIQLPLLANLVVNPTGRNNLKLYGGLAPELVGASKTRISSYSSSPMSPAHETSSDTPLEGVRRFNCELHAGFKVDDASNHSIKSSIGFRGGYTLLPVFTGEQSSAGNLKTQMLSLSFNIGMLF